MNIYLTALLTIFLTTYLVSAKHDRWCSPNSIPSGKCGRHLDELLGTTCGRGGFYSPDFSSDNFLPGKRNPLGEVLLGKREANMYLEKRRDYFYQGIVCECCIHQCTILELKSYCT
ncbi:insulin-like [Ruditapes philippinarum]|uniref:insulin-like n=1 Tax=Ruditapes philippinarum TaxID=129788 RepID=UPI00295B86B8|nr:insulin-like [Ruditapes philippinarum]